MIKFALCVATNLGLFPIVQNLDVSLLANIPPFRDLNREALSTIQSLATSRLCAEGTEVFAEGTPAEYFYLLLDGHIRVVRTTEDGEQIIARVIASGQLFGIAPALGFDLYPASAIAADECLILAWPTRHWATFSHDYPSFATNTYEIVGQRLQDINNRVVELATQHVERRVALALLRLLNQTGRKTEDGILIDMPVTRQDLSEMAGTTLHTVSRLLSAWGKDKIIKSGRRKVTILEAHRLVLIAEGRT